MLAPAASDPPPPPPCGPSTGATRDAVEGEFAAAAAAAGAVQHRCKVCGKGFSCGRSLGGHMRSHISLGKAVAEVVDGADDELRRVSGANGGRSANGAAVGYGLRENPKKTRRLSDFAEEEEEVEEDGGSGGDGGGHRACVECGKLFSSWRSLFGHMRSHASGARDHDEEEEDVDDLQGEEFFAEEEETEAEPEAEEPEEESMVAPMEPPVAVIAAPPRRRRRSMRVAAPAPAPPPVLSGFEKEQEDVALCLLMLSRDTGLWSSPEKEEPLEKDRKTVAKQAYLTRNGYAYNSDDDSAPLHYGDARNKSGGGIDVVKSKKRRTSYYAPNSISPKKQCDVPAPPPAKRTRYECPGCGRVFSSYQALGGHRASHKRINTSCSAPKAAATPAPAPEPSVETYTSFSTLSPSASPDSVAAGIGAKKPAAAADKFECPVCFRVFASGQALGGHKRSHVMAEAACSDDGELYGSASGGNAEQEQEHSVAVARSLDLNFPPAPSEEA